ncbi:mechanosensitive ion channel domain-containing protein [Actibacterium sp. 188UL27-1]|uniref:mechanosensitive ion channel domain-containing protein n=1 Tax=Actibacterium sp. 188UL27-1 TaxID=2786961 RepID=UPI001EF5E3D2|nr:mechanosensitive ion channel domain-containing protein [Actibacterium sp. 188UL27-1]
MTEPAQLDGTIEVGDAATADGQIRDRIQALLSQIDGFDQVRITVSQGVVTAEGEVLDNARRSQLSQILGRVAGVVAIEDNTIVSGTLEERLSPAVDRIYDRSRNILTNVPIFLVALSAFLVIAVLGWALTTRVALWNRIAPNRFIADVYRAIARIVFILLGVILALDILNATALIGAVLGAAGVVGLAVGFAVRDTVENFIASILLSLRQPFRPNDFIEIDGDIGTVARLTSRATILISPEGNHIRIPNATVFKNRIVNYTRDPQRRFTFDLGVDADSDLNAALTTAVDALTQLPFVLHDPDIGAWIKEVGDSNVVLTFAGWIDQSQTDFLRARGEAIRTAKVALESADFGLPEPIYRVRLDGQMTQTGTTSKPAPEKPATATEAAPPPAADPNRAEDAQTDAAERERRAANADGDLLNEGQKVE